MKEVDWDPETLPVRRKATNGTPRSIGVGIDMNKSGIGTHKLLEQCNKVASKPWMNKLQ
jgi:N-acetylglutamate synthase-like GNAT family acetyltransferase